MSKPTKVESGYKRKANTPAPANKVRRASTAIERADDTAPDPFEGVGVGVELVLEVVLVRVLVGVTIGGRVLVEERVVVVVVSETVDGMLIEDELSEGVGGISAETVSVGEMHVGVPIVSRLHSYPSAKNKIS